MDHKAIAENNTILRVLTGSQLYGTNVGDSGDRDEKGVCVEPIEAVLGFHEFEQFEKRTAEEREHKHDAKPQAGDLDLTVYGLRKFLRLAMRGNPSITELLFVPKESCLVLNRVGAQLQELAPLIVSKQAGKAYLGYMFAQKQRLMGELGQKKVNRPELEEKYGFDTKFAMHVLRLGLQGVELLSTGRITLPLPEAERTYLKAVRTGDVPLQDVLSRAGDLERELKDLLDHSPLPEVPNEKVIEAWMIGAYRGYWDTIEFLKEEIRASKEY